MEMQASTEQQVTSFFQSKGIELDNGSIEACFPITKRNAGDRQAILIRFCNRKHKAALLKEGRKLKGTDVYVNEHLTKENAEIAKQARFLKKLKKIQQTWTVNGKIFIKLNGAPEEAKVVQVRSMEELRKFE